MISVSIVKIRKLLKNKQSGRLSRKGEKTEVIILSRHALRERCAAVSYANGVISLMGVT